MRCGFAYGTGQWRVEITDTEGMPLADLNILSEIHLALALHADLGDGLKGGDEGGEAPVHSSASAPLVTAPASPDTTGRGGWSDRVGGPEPAAQPSCAAGSADGGEEAAPLSTREALLSIGIEPQDLDRALAQLGEDADPGATLDAIESLSATLSPAPPPVLQRQRTGENGRTPMPAVVDGMNVAVGAGRGLLFVGGALRRACDTLRQLGCTPIHVVLPQARIDEAHRLVRGREPRLRRFPLTNPEEVVALEREGLVLPAPPTARSGTSYDDIVVIDAALQLDALVVSCDQYRCDSRGLRAAENPTHPLPFAGTCARDIGKSISSC